jgi:co-chaperonin GroES (HSP10)
VAKTKSKYIAATDKIVIVVDKATDKVSRGGIIIPGSVQPQPRRAVVVSVGPDVKTTLKPDDKILYNCYAGAPFDDGDGQILVISERELYAVVED